MRHGASFLLRTLTLVLGAAPAFRAPLAAQSGSPAESLAQADRAAAEAVGRDGAAAGFPALLAPDGALLWPGAPVVVGPDAARRLLLGQRSLDSLRITWQPLGLEVSQDGGFGVSWGVAVAIPPSRAPRLGRYIAAWRRSGEAWHLAAFVAIGLVPAAETPLPPELLPVRRPPLGPTGGAAAFIAADLAFARLAGDSGAALAFERYAAPDAITLGSVLHRGPAAIGQSLRGGPRSSWAWHPVLAGSSALGDLGFTVGESEIRPEGAPVNYGKYLTIWRRLPGGEVRFLTDGGNARPAAP